MRTIQNLKVALQEALEREQALIEAFETEIEESFQGRDVNVARGMFQDQIDMWDENRYIPSMKFLRQKIEDGKVRAEEWRKNQEGIKSTSS